MSPPVSLLDTEGAEPLIPASRLRHELPCDEASAATVAQSRRTLRAILHGQDERVAVLVGPCSIHDPAAALDYARRLRALRERLGDALELVMRVYFEKPRTTVGWKGLINDPGLDGSHDVNGGLRLARSLLRDINALGVPAGTEFLDTMTHRHLEDLVSWGAIGARTTESPLHRQMASGLPMPVGFKNGTSGEIGVAADAIVAARHAQRFIGLGAGGQAAIVATPGNPDAHLILRGGSVPNYDEAGVQAACEALTRSKLPPRLVIDASHANSRKRAENQPAVIDDIAARVAAGEHRIVGVMIESHLVGGRQDLVAGQPLAYGQSITDACIGWDDSVSALERLAEAVRLRRERQSRTAA